LNRNTSPDRAVELRGPRARGSLADSITWLIVAATMIGLPLLINLSGKDAFRLPKQLLMEGSGIILAAAALCATILGVPLGQANRWPRRLVMVVMAALLWSAVTTLASTNRTLSVFSLLTLTAATMLFVAAYNSVQNRSIAVVYVALAPAVINACIAIAQRTAIWIPFRIEEQQNTSRLRTIGLFGNPNDLGMFMVSPALAAIALASASPRHRVPATVIFALLSTALIASETIGAIAAVAVGIFALLYRIRPRLAVLGLLFAFLLALTVVGVSGNLPQVRAKILTAARGDFDPLLSGRIPGFVTAWRMFRANPIAGVGLGCFGLHYFDEKIAIASEDPSLGTIMSSHPENFAEAHNEHLQIMAEGGLPAYAIFIIALSILARVSFCELTEPNDRRSVFAQTVALPLAVAIFVLTLTAFPLRVAGPTANGLFICALTLSWSARAND
jgi:O-antigen ligase